MPLPSVNFTTINHIARVKFGLSLGDYAVADLIYHLSNNPSSPTAGWCFASKEEIAGMLDLGVATVYRSLELLASKGLIEKHPQKKNLLRGTQLWYDENYINNGGYQNDSQAIKMIVTDYQNDSHPIKMIADDILQQSTSTGILLDNNNIIKKEKEIYKEKEKIINRVTRKLQATDLTYFTNLSPNILWEFEQKYGLSEDLIRKEAGRAADWLKSTGKTYNNYHFFFRNWLSRVAERFGQGKAQPQKRFALENFDKYKGLDDKADRESKEWLARNRPEQFKEVCGMDAQEYLDSLTPS